MPFVGFTNEGLGCGGSKSCLGGEPVSPKWVVLEVRVPCRVPFIRVPYFIVNT